ncbi:hypothetical protein BBJ28_00013927, partial [Nothophytophthora sp. Chile5]
MQLLPLRLRLTETLAVDPNQQHDEEEELPPAPSRDASPLDISLAQLRAKETITRISPDKRALVEEIDSEA